MTSIVYQDEYCKPTLNRADIAAIAFSDKIILTGAYVVLAVSLGAAGITRFLPLFN